MATDMILPALGMAQDSGKVVQWLKKNGEHVQVGDLVVAVETDKATVELEAPVAGTLIHQVPATAEDIPVGQIIARILNGEDEAVSPELLPVQFSTQQTLAVELPERTSHSASPLAAKMAAEHNLDLAEIKPSGKRIQKADVLSYMQKREKIRSRAEHEGNTRLSPASPKARRLAMQRGIDLIAVQGSGPDGAVLLRDLPEPVAVTPVLPAAYSSPVNDSSIELESSDMPVSGIWRIMAERTTQSWTRVPHFFLLREVNASRLIAWREQLLKRMTEKVTYTDLLVKVVATALQEHPRLNATWQEGKITLNEDVNIGIAVAVNDGLLVPVIKQASKLSLKEIAQQRKILVERAQAGKLWPRDMQEGTFTISNLGMYGVDAFTAIINPPQSAILAVSRIADRVIAVHGQPAVQPVMTCSLSCDHRVIDGARGAQFLGTLAELLEEPLGLIQ